MRKPSKTLLRSAANVFATRGATEVYIFGSQATGRAGRASDVDFAVVGLPASHSFQAMGEAWDLLGHPIDLVDLDDDGPLVQHLKAAGELVRVI